MPTISTSVGTIAYSDQGDGSPVLLLHATLHDRTDFDPVLDALLKGRRVLAVGFPGHGDSPRPLTPLALELANLAPSQRSSSISWIYGTWWSSATRSAATRSAATRPADWPPPAVTG